MIGKIQKTHLERKAMIYVRQSTTTQVMDNQESTARQYGLKERALSLGWAKGAIEIIDEDLGQSGKSANHREGFKRLAQEVSHGLVGGIFALEVSRLSRSSHDWQQLLSLCAVANVVVADETTTYDPKQPDDKLLLDLKGTMSEAELHWLSLRLAGARLNKARRGAMRLLPPTGYIWSDGGYVKDPDQAVQQAIQVLFEQFAIEVSAMAVVRWAHRTGYKVPTRVYRAGLDSEVKWRKLTVTRLCNILHNPTFAGIYVYGQYKQQRVIKEGKIATQNIRVSSDSWPIKIEGAHVGYIDIKTYEKNRATLLSNKNNQMMRSKGTVKEGAALLSGLLICGECGRPIKTHYAGHLENYYSYICEGEHPYGGGRCFSLPGRQIDQAVAEKFLQTVIPEELSLTLAVEQEAIAQAEVVNKKWRLRVEQTTYQARLCEKRYKAVDPENRVVARTLETQWNESLEALEEVQREYAQARIEHKVELTESDRRRIRQLASNLKTVWEAKTTRNSERKVMLGLVIEAISLTPVHIPQRQTKVLINWKSGVVDEIYVARPSRKENYRTPEAVINRIQEQCKAGVPDAEIAQQMNTEGYQTGRGMPFNTAAVRWVRRRNGIRRKDHRIGAHPLPDRFPDGSYSKQGLAKYFSVTKHVVERWIQQGTVHGRKGSYGRYPQAWKLTLDPETENILQTDAAKSKKRLW